LLTRFLIETVQVVACIYLVHYLALLVTRGSRNAWIAFPRLFLIPLLSAPLVVAAAFRSDLSLTLLATLACVLILLQGEGFAHGRSRARFLPGRRSQRILALRTYALVLPLLCLGALSPAPHAALLAIGEPIHTALSFPVLQFPILATGMILMLYHLAPAVLHRLEIGDRVHEADDPRA
jgi:hypothetical protein